MGSTQANEMADAVRAGEVSLEAALHWHLVGNHYPPHPSYMVAVARRALEKAGDGRWDAKVRLPAGVTWKGKRMMTVSAVIESLHLESFLEGAEDDL